MSSGTHSHQANWVTAYAIATECVPLCTYAHWVCVVCGPVVHTANHTHWITNTHCVGVEWYLHSVAIACAVMFAWFGCVYHWTTHNWITNTHCVGVEWYLHSVAIACAVTQFAWGLCCVYQWYTQPNQANWITAHALRRCRVVLTLCSDCVCGDPVRLVWLCVPLDHTQHKPHCVGVSGTYTL